MPLFTGGRRRVLSLVVAGAGSAMAVAPAQAQDPAWPSRPLRIVVPITAGGLSDAIARRIATRLAERLGQPAVVDNRPGASTMVGRVAVAKSPPDGYTLLFALTAHVQNAVHFKKIGYDPFGDFTPLARPGHAPKVPATRSDVGAATPADFIRLGRGKQSTYGAYATGPQVILEVFNVNQESGPLPVPYKG